MTVNAVNGVATFSTLSLNNVGTGYLLNASSLGLSGANSAMFNIVSALPALTLAKTVLPTDAAPGGTVTYSITYNNYNGTVAASNVTITDALPANVTYVPNSASGNATYDAATATLTWSLGALTIGGSGQVSFQVTVAPTAAMGDIISNTASISCTETAPVQSNDAVFTVIDLRGDWWMFRHDLPHTGCSAILGPSVPTAKWQTVPMLGGIYSSPAFGLDGTIYVGSANDNLYALNPANGAVKWQFLTEGNIYSSPAIGMDGTIYVGSNDDNLYAINPADGSLKWCFPTGNAIDSSPVIDEDGIIYVGSMDGNLYAINPDGSQKWSAPTEGDIYSSPAIGADGTLYVGSFDNNLYAFNPWDGSVKWKFATENEIYSSPTIGADGTIYVGSSDNNLYAVNPNGTQRWHYTTNGGIFSSPAISADGSMVYVGSEDSNLYALSTADGALRWPAFSTAGSIVSSPAIDASGTIYIGSNDATLYALNPTGTLKWKYSASSDLQSSPAIGGDGTIYVGSIDGSFYAITSSVPILTLAKSVSTTCAEPNGVVSYTLSYTNFGCSATNVVISDVLPANVILASASGNATYNAATSTLSWALGTLAANASGHVTFQVTVAANARLGSIITNVADIVSTEAPAPRASNPVFFTVVGPQTQLFYQVQPSNTEAGTPFNPTVTVLVQDANGDTITTATDEITLTLAPNPFGGTPGCTLNGTATVTAVNGVATFTPLWLNKIGTGYTLIASTTGLPNLTSDPFNVTPGLPAQLVFLTPPSNTVAGDTMIPAVTVQVLDAYGNPVATANNPITLQLASNPGNGVLGGAVTVNAVNGVATFNTLTVNKVGTGYTLSASSNGLNGAISSAFNITPNLPTHLAFSVQPSTTVAGIPIAPAVKVQVQDAFDNLVPTAFATITLALGANPGGSTLGGILAENTVAGTATFSTLTLNKVGIGYTLNASAGGLGGGTSSPFNITPNVPDHLAFQTQPSTTVAGVVIAPAVTVQVLDVFGNLVTTANNSITLALAANPGGSTLGGVLTMNAINGVATFNTLTLNKVGIGYTLSASSPTLTGATSIAFNITPNVPNQLVFQTQPSTTVAGVTITPAVTVKVLDFYGNLVTTATNAITLALATNPGGSTLGGTVTVAAINGVATFNTLTLNKVGIGYTLSASSPTLTGATSTAFNITVAPSAQLVFLVQPSTTVAGIAIAPAVTVQVQDAFGNPEPTAVNAITLALAANPGGSTLGGTLTVNAVNGVATFSTLTLNKVGIGYTLSASSPTLTGATSTAFNITPNVPAQLVFQTQPSTTVAGTIITPAVTVQVLDIYGNLVTTANNAITLALAANPGGSTLAGTLTVNAVNGVATFSTLTLNKVGIGYTLSASSPTLTGATSAAFNITFNSPAQLAFSGQPSNTVAGVAITPAVTVQVLDAYGNLVTNATNQITIALASNPGGSTLGGTLTANAVNGVATFSTLWLNNVGTGYTLSAWAVGLSFATSSAFNITPAAPAQLAFQTDPSTTVAGSIITPAVTVQVLDTYRQSGDHRQ